MFHFFSNLSNKRLQGYTKVIVLVGGGGYVGKAFLKKYSEAENTLFIVVSRSATGFRDNVIGIRGDITTQSGNLVKRILALAGRIDVVVHLSATYAFETSAVLTRTAMLREFDVNTVAPVIFTQEVKKQHWSKLSSNENLFEKKKVVVVGSQAGEGKTNREELVTYSGTKAALRVVFDYYSSHLATFGIKTIFLKPGGLQSQEALDTFIDQLNESIVS